MRSFRPLDPGMGEAVAKRTYLRKGENWGDLAERVALGNTMLHKSGIADLENLTQYIADAKLIPAGRHLQHGDATQVTRNLEVFSNCSTACMSFMKFLLLMNGSGVGRSYSDDIMMVDWSNMPNIYCVLDSAHPDFNSDFVIAKGDHSKYPEDADLYHLVKDSREGWVRIVELIETAAYSKKKYDNYVFDFSLIRKNGTPIKGMQNRPASGPIPLISAINNMAKVKEMELPIWKQTMFIDHYLSECVANGGARRSARIAIKQWNDKDILDFITIKKHNPWMWSSNNSVGVDEEFWQTSTQEGTLAYKVLNAVVESSYGDGSGEPGLINLSKLTVK